MGGPRWAFEDFIVGLAIPLGPVRVEADAITSFAREWDPQPMHLDEGAGRDSLLGGLAASGWHTCALLMRMMCDAYLSDSTSQGAPGVDSVRWLAPVLAFTAEEAVIDFPSGARLGIRLAASRH